jgi:beta-galactosidase
MWLNSHLVAGRPYGHSSFRVDLTPFVQPQKDNVIAIRVNSRPESSRWSAGGGYRCWLTETSPIHVENTVVSTQIVTDKSTNVDVQVNARNDSTKDSRVDVFNEVFTIDGNDRRTHFVCSNNQFNYMLTRGKPTLFTSRFELDEASLWDTVHPRRYVVATRIEIHGQVMDTYDTIFGTSIGKIEPSAWKLP